MPALDFMLRSAVHIPRKSPSQRSPAKIVRFPQHLLRTSFGDADVNAPPQ